MARMLSPTILFFRSFNLATEHPFFGALPNWYSNQCTDLMFYFGWHMDASSLPLGFGSCLAFTRPAADDISRKFSAAVFDRFAERVLNAG